MEVLEGLSMGSIEVPMGVRVGRLQLQQQPLQLQQQPLL
jgi:hypothetical protein